MALAILKYVGKSDGHHEFEADTGTNGYYQYKAGKAKRRHRGLEFVDEVAYQSAILKVPVTSPNSFETRFRFRIPDQAVTRESRFIQLSSYRGPNMQSPAVSEIVTVLPSINDLNGDYKLPKIMSLTHTLTHSETRRSEVPVERALCDIKENKVSEAMFFNALLGALPNLLTNALPMISKIIPGLQKALPIAEKVLPELTKIIPSDVKPGKEGLDQILKNISPETIKAIMEVVQGVQAKSDNSTQGKSETKSIERYSHDFSINPNALLQLAPLLEKVLSPESIRSIGDNPVLLFKAISDSAVKFQAMEPSLATKMVPAVTVTNGSKLDKVVQGMALRRQQRQRYSEAKIAPALLAALPALMPLIEKVASPEMISAIGEQPVKLFNAVADAGLKHQKAEFDHLEKINPGVDDAGFDKIVASMSVKSSVTIKAKVSDAYEIEFMDVKTVPVAGKEKVVFDRRQKIHIPLRILAGKGKDQRPNQIPKAIIQVIIQDGDSMSVLLEKKFKVSGVVIGSPVTGISIETEDLRKLPANRNLKLEVSLNWKKGEKVEGTFKNHYIWLSDGYFYQRSGKNIRQHFSLNDVARFRNYWHKVWEGGPETHNRWKIDFECKYYYALNEKDNAIRKFETKKKTVTDSAHEKGEDDYRRKIVSKLKSGMEISLAAYNELLSLHQLPPLTAAQLAAFRAPEFAKEASVSARVSVDFKGKKGETAALWTYPEGNIQSYVLGKVTTVDPSGMITAVQEEEVFFPKFSTVHFIGTKSE
jgi:hypothetical protein